MSRASPRAACAAFAAALAHPGPAGALRPLNVGSGEAVSVRMAVPGRHNVSNALAAVTAARACGVSFADAVAARAGARTLLATHRRDTIGEMSCNPAIGGLGKGHLVREVDALDGLMGRVIDRAGIQFRMLNRSKGPAVRGPRAQADRKLYRQTMQAILADYPGLHILEAAVEDLILENVSRETGAGQGVAGIVTADGTQIRAKAVVLTTGTFLKGVIHVGERRIPAGRCAAMIARSN